MPQQIPDESGFLPRLRAQWPRIAAEMLRGGIAATVPSGLPEDHFNDEVLPAIILCGNAAFEALAYDRALSYDEVHAFAAPVAERHAEDRLPLRTLLTGIADSAQILLAEAAALAGPADLAELVTFGQRLLTLLSNINITVVSTYTEVEQSIYHAEREARRELCAALVAGRPAAGLAARADTAVADSYSVLSIRLDVDDSPVSAAHLITRRRMRLLQRALDELTTETTPSLFDGVHGTALIAGYASATAHRQERWQMLADRLTEQFGADVHVIVTPDVAPEDLPAAVADGGELAELAAALGRPAGAYGLDDLLLEYQITRPSPARDRLAARVSPLFEQPHLLDALQAHLKHGANRKEAAREVFVHPNTLTYRLRRVGELTGLDPADPHDSRILAAALTVTRLQHRPIRA
ncbi:PucR family transcriptional regulator [Gordonia neofelifaecis]|uniref:Putative transcriptional regulator n=1 Tax=Gordonia neofelifaecis NRRL B-59395 TaxID=644548 RepID=F1YJW8_9ACTN|nr:PucR family transcriptional regulator [Gordonia neofelifaecis]EGD55050.1 putative transcriptional regulator [Gordonia neofelifaecis NRRL B-59395]